MNIREMNKQVSGQMSYVSGLGMFGSEKFAVRISAYAAHQCSRACQKEFEESADKIVLGTEIPAGSMRELVIGN